MENNNIDTNVIDLTTDATTVTIPVRVKLSSYNQAPFEFTSSIDESGQIVLTPTSKYVSFEDAKTSYDYEDETDLINKKTTTVSTGDQTFRETTIMLTASMICEDTDKRVSADIDEIGQAVIYPVSKNNVFVTASIEDSLNLVTEDMSVEEYFGYRLINNGDGWDVKDSEGTVIEEGIATKSEAKIFVLTHELNKIKNLSEELLDTPEKESDKNTEENNSKEIPEVSAEIVEEAVENEKELNRTNIINRFLQGDVPLFSDNGTPLETYIHINELDSNGYVYYYDEESDSIVSYPEEQ